MARVSDQMLVRLLEPGDHRATFGDGAILEELIRQANHHRVGALAAQAWQEYLPADGQEWRKRTLAKNWTLLQDRVAKMEQVLALLEGAGVEVICLKGPAVGCRYYDPPFLRKPSNDLDFGVRAADIGRTLAPLATLGYQPEPLDKAFACNHHVEFFGGDRLHLELHFRLSHGSAGIPMEQFFQRTQTVRLPGEREVRLLGDADQLLHLLLHAGGSGHKSLFHLIELRRVSQATSQEARQQAIRRAIDGHFAGTVAIIQQSFRYYWNEPFAPPGVQLPRTWLGWMIDPEFHLRYRNWKPDGSPVTAALWLRVRLMEVILTDRPTDALHLLVRMMKSAWYGLKRIGKE